VIFFWRGGVAFLQGVFEKLGAERGFFVVSLWSIAGELWCLEWRF
jgi:hypothetical protein